MNQDDGKFPVNIFTTPISYEAGKAFNESQARVTEGGGDFSAYVDATQQNFRILLKAIAGLEHEIRELKGETDETFL